MMRAFLLPLFCCVCAQGPAGDDASPQADQARIETAEPAAPTFAARVPIAGMRLVGSTSVLRFEGLQERPHSLQTIYVFPDRGRWTLRAIGEDRERGARVLRYRAGDRFYGLAAGHAKSEELTEHAAQEALLQFELRRAALLWPDGFAWTGEGKSRTAKLAQHGTLTAEFSGADNSLADRQTRPVRFLSHYADGAPCERFEAVRWSKDSRWPAGWELWLGERRVWTEELTLIEHRGDYLDFFFMPPDRRRGPVARLGSVEFQHADLPRRAVRRHSLDPAWTDLGDARRAARKAAESWRAELAELGTERIVAASLELDALGHASALLARVDAPGEIPSAWGATEVIDGPALLIRLPVFGPVPADRLRALEGRRPVGSRPAAFELRWDEKAGVRVLLPLLPRPL